MTDQAKLTAEEQAEKVIWECDHVGPYDDGIICQDCVEKGIRQAEDAVRDGLLDFMKQRFPAWSNMNEQQKETLSDIDHGVSILEAMAQAIREGK